MNIPSNFNFTFFERIQTSTPGSQRLQNRIKPIGPPRRPPRWQAKYFIKLQFRWPIIAHMPKDIPRRVRKKRMVRLKFASGHKSNICLMRFTSFYLGMNEKRKGNERFWEPGRLLKPVHQRCNSLPQSRKRKSVLMCYWHKTIKESNVLRNTKIPPGNPSR